MLSGDTPPTPAESILRLVQVSLVTSRWIQLHAATWTLDLLSPFWRLYVHDAPGAVLSVNGRQIPIRPGYPMLVPAWVRFRTTVVGQPRQNYVHFILSGFPASLHRGLFPEPIELQPGDLPKELIERWRTGLAATPAPGCTATRGLPRKNPAGFEEQQASLQSLPPAGPAPEAYAWAAATVYAGLASAFARLDVGQRERCQTWLTGSDGIRLALAAIEQRMGDPPRNTELAALCGISVNQLIRRFRATLGMTPARYGQERRIAVAAYWLLNPQRSLDEIASAAGFSDRFHFSRAFRTHFGVAPAAWRRRHAAVR
ncbi:MAG: AraC family transcriptional regulator [Planctomycetota bacterium]|nr:MAG: AraC family transcriptional regulator [Planctomycetota bacterium]